ncbi:MAG TPA: hypothetical protein V6D15_02745 [Oculatellaceae cyanobacterium]
MPNYSEAVLKPTFRTSFCIIFCSDDTWAAWRSHRSKNLNFSLVCDSASR